MSKSGSKFDRPGNEICKSVWGPSEPRSDAEKRRQLERVDAVELARQSAKFRAKKGLRPLTPADHERMYGWPIDLSNERVSVDK